MVAPVFKWYGNVVSLYGLLWGGSGNGNEQTFWFSALANIEYELGALETHYSGLHIDREPPELIWWYSLCSP